MASKKVPKITIPPFTIPASKLAEIKRKTENQAKIVAKQVQDANPFK